MKSAIQNEMLQLVEMLEQKSLITNEQYLLLKQDFEPLIDLAETDDWNSYRKLFIKPPKKDFEVEPMNSANLCPTFVPVLNGINILRLGFNDDISMQLRQQRYSSILESIRKVIALHVGAVAHPTIKNIALVRNTSEANNQLSKGFNLWEGNTVLLWDENHPTNYNVWKLRETETKRVETFSLKTIDFINWTDERIIRGICDIITQTIERTYGKTVMLSFSEVSNISGICMPSREIIACVRALYPDIHIHVDGAVSWGALDINLIEKNNVKGIDCDSFASSSHKWLMGPCETGIFYMKPELAKNFDISIHAYDGKIGFKDELPEDTSRFELLGQRDDANIYALGQTILKHNDINGDDSKRIEKRVKYLLADLRTKLNYISNRLRVRINYTTPVSKKFSNGVAVFNFISTRTVISHEDLYNYLYGKKGEKARFAVGYIPKNTDYPRPESLRICPHIMNLPTNISSVVLKIATFIDPNHRITKKELDDLTIEEV
jgi:cysteine desulfurase/selenocysteine lyase